MTSLLSRRLIYGIGALASWMADRNWGMATRLIQRLYLTAHVAGKRLLDGRELRAFADLAKPGMTVCDVGANVGIMAVAFAQRVGPQGRVLAFEPEPFNAAVFRRHLEHVPLGNVALFEMALAERAGTRLLRINRACRADSRIAPEGAARAAHSMRIQCESLDAVLERLGIGSVDLVKMDVQGFEPFVLRGMRSTLAKNPRLQLIVELYPTGLAEHGHSAQSLMNQLFEAFPVVERWDGSTWVKVRRELAIAHPADTGPSFYCDLWCHS